MKFKNIKYIAVLGAAVALSSCNDFLDQVPDNRIDPQTPDQVLLVLTGGYSGADYTLMCEQSSDNVVDNHAPDANGTSYPTTVSDPIDDQVFAWEDADKNSMQDTPTFLWTQNYHAIASANLMLEKIAEFRANGQFTTGDDAAKLNAAYGEALVMRAYYHFILVNLFAMQYDANNPNQQGIPYVEVPESKPVIDYQRNTVAEVYDKIERDLLEGLKYVNDQYYSDKVKWHFNKAAANAFAARFYLNKRDYAKVETYATAAIGDNPAAMLRSDYWNTSFTSLDADASMYYSSSANNNLLLIPTVSSTFNRICFGGNRYALNRSALTSTIYSQGPTWSGNVHPAYSTHLYVNSQQDWGCWPSWKYRFVQWIDKVAGTGYGMAVRNEFTVEETLLMRAEARIFMNDLPGAVSDLRIWDESRQVDPENNSYTELTDEVIKAYYSKDAATTAQRDPRQYILQDLNIEQVCPPAQPEYKYTDDKLPYLWCLLHFRRIETVLTGMRWFDIKRYGIEITHQIGSSRTETLTINDPRRAFQLPIEALSAGIEPTSRENLAAPKVERVVFPDDEK